MRSPAGYGEGNGTEADDYFLARARVIIVPAAAPAPAPENLTPLDFLAIRLKIANPCFGGMPSFSV